MVRSVQLFALPEVRLVSDSPPAATWPCCRRFGRNGDAVLCSLDRSILVCPNTNFLLPFGGELRRTSSWGAR